MDYVLINGFVYEVYRLSKKDIDGLLEISFHMDREGKHSIKKFDEVFGQDSFRVTIPEYDIDFVGKRKGYHYQYEEDLGDDQTVKFVVTISEVEEREELDPEFAGNIFNNTLREAFYSKIKFRALIELLEEKGIITRNEIEEKIQFVKKRDKAELLGDLKKDNFKKKER